MEIRSLSEKKRILDGIRSSRPSNLVRIFMGLVFISISLYYNLTIPLYLSMVHLSFGLFWLVLIERFFLIYEKYSFFWFGVATADVIWVIFWVYLTGTTYSVASLGLILITTLSSMDLKKIRGQFVSYLGSFIFSLLSIVVFNEWMPNINLVINGEPTPLTLFSVILSIILLTASNWATNRTLYQIYFQLNERNEELRSAFSEISKLKIQQDGDYFLTSLLIEPLASVQTEGNSFLIQSKVRQYKTFLFNEAPGELGGDLNLTSMVILDKEYLFFMNADAMGKSIQGAGGVLVLSSVLKAILERTKAGSFSQTTGRDWLRMAYKELNSVFESFEGSMYVTCILGVICEKTGAVWMIRSEHPHAIFYHDDIGETVLWEIPSSSKLGTPQHYAELLIVETSIKDSDFLLLGSDGKDDLLEFHNKGDFLDLVKETKGDWETIWERLDATGQLTDDLSLLKITKGIAK